MNSARGRFGMVSMVLAACAAGLAGCATTDNVSYSSDTWSPKTITIRDTRSGESVLTVDVPVGQQLNLVFEERAKDAESRGTDRLRWALRPLGDASTAKGSLVSVPPPSARRIDVSLRKAPESAPKAEMK